MLTAIIETAQMTTRKIRNMLLLKNEYELRIKEVLGSFFSVDLLQLMFMMPYLKIGLLEKKELAHRQTASSWLKTITDAVILKPQKIGRTTYYINYILMEILAAY